VKLGNRVAAAAIAVPLALGLAACGGSDKKESTGTAPTPVTSQPTTSAPATTAPPKVAAPVAHLNRVTFAPAMKSALAKQKTWRTNAVMTVGGQTLMTMSGYQQTQPTAMSMTMSGAAFQGKTTKLLLVKNAMYLSIPGSTPAGKYLKIDLSAGEKNDVASLLDSADPTKSFKAFDKGVRSVKLVGSETVGGVKLDKYEVVVDTAQVVAQQGKKLPAGAPKTLPFTLWMDAAHVVHKMSFNLQGVSMVMTMTEYNKAVSIVAPPAAKIVKSR
jgi:hypothetical protein